MDKQEPDDVDSPARFLVPCWLSMAEHIFRQVTGAKLFRNHTHENVLGFLLLI